MIARYNNLIPTLEFNRMNIVSTALLALVAPFVMYNPYQFYLLLIISVFMVAFKGIKQKTFFEKTPLDIPIFLLLVSVLISIVFVANPFHSLPRVANILLYILLFYALSSLLKSPGSIKMGLIVFLIFGISFSVFGATGMLNLNVKHFDFLAKLKELLPSINIRLPGAVEGIHPNAVGGLLTLFIPVFFILVFFRVNKPKGKESFLYGKMFKWFAVFGLIISVFVLILTQSRGAWAGLFFGLLAMFAVKAKRKKVIIVVLLVVFILILFILYYSLNQIEKVQLMARQVKDTIAFRISMWDLAVRIIHTHPLLGIGLNEFRYHFEMNYDMSHAHNSFLNIAVELGLPSVVVYMILLINIGYMTLSTWEKSPSRWSSYLILGLGSGQFAHLIFSLTDTIRLGSRAGIFFWISAAFITAIYNDSIQKYQDEPESRVRENE